MAHYIKISNLGPIKNCEMAVSDFTVLTGPQASGKSTIAKAVYFFRTIKDDILDLITWPNLKNPNKKPNLKSELIRHLRIKFMELFGTTFVMPENMTMEYFYEANNKRKCVRVYLEETFDGKNRNIIKFKFGSDIDDLLYEANQYALPIGNMELSRLQLSFEKCFEDEHETFFIPAGRSTITLLSGLLSFLFTSTSIDSWQLRAIDYCTRKYVEFILKIRSWFSDSLSHIFDLSNAGGSSSLISAVQNHSEKVLNAKYRYVENEERLYLMNDTKLYTKINLASSGQQESVWIFNLLTYFLAEKKKIFLVIEEPEAHLYPSAQMHITDVLALFFNGGANSLMITTHSPYILGELNNLLLCGQIPSSKSEFAKKIIDKRAWIKAKHIGAAHVHNGTYENAIDTESGIIKNELIDGASEVINERCDKLLDLLYGEEAE